jgi:hypothetical protein
VEVSACEKFLLGLRVDGQMPVLGGLSVPDVVHVGVLGGAGAALPGKRGLVEDHGVAVIGQDVSWKAMRLICAPVSWKTLPRSASTWSRPW